MLRNIIRTIGLTAIIAVMALTGAQAQQGIVRDYNDNDNDRGGNDPDRIKVDRYLTTEIWTNHEDGEYFEGDNIVINFLTNRDAFVIIYSVDTKGRLNLLFPVSADEDNFVEGGQVYRLPGSNDDFDLVVNGPEGTESIQIIASRDRIPIPDWYPQSGLTDDGWEDRYDFMDYINSRYFVRYTGQRFAFDRTSLYINEWEPDYYRPIYYPDYPSWTVTGNVYIDYPYGGTVYINGIYWGVAPLYIPRIYVGWHTLTIYDPYGYCWEHDVHITRYNTLVLDRHIIRPTRTVVSRYTEVQRYGYRDPIKYGYPNYKTKKVVNVSTVGSAPSAKKSTTTSSSTNTVFTKKFLRGTNTSVVKTDRGYETKGTGINNDSKKTTTRGFDGSSSKSATSSGIKSTSRQSTGSSKYKSSSSPSSGKENSSVYKRNSGSKSSKSGSSSGTQRVKKSSTSSSKSSGTVQKKSSGSSQPKSSGKVEKKSSSSGSSKSSGKSSTSPSKSSKSSDGKSSGGKKKK